MTILQNRGNISSKIWFICDLTDEDKQNGAVLSGSASYHFDKMLSEASLPEPFITYWENNSNLLNLLHTYHPPLIGTVGKNATKEFVPSVASKKKPFDVQLDKQAGSLLISPKFNFNHYVVPFWSVDRIYSEWAYRDIYINLDLGRIKEELSYYENMGKLNELPKYNFLLEPSYGDLIDFLMGCMTKKYISHDIETIRPTKKSIKYASHPGYPYIMGFARSRSEAVSFSYWDYSPKELVNIWRLCNALFQSVPIIGQNYFNFDLWFQEALGFNMNPKLIHDTYIRAHILWPELEKSLQFLTKQYTRQPYYKDEGKNWSPKQKKDYMKYNALDCVVQYTVFEEQEKEFNVRQHLK